MLRQQCSRQILSSTVIEQDIYGFSSQEKYDVILFSQAFHHMDSPVYLLKRLRHMLTPEGVVLIVGEHRFSALQAVRNFIAHYAKYTLNWRGYRERNYFFPGYSTLFPADLAKGDNHYHAGDYLLMFQRSVFS